MRFFKEKAGEIGHRSGDEHHRRQERKQWATQNRIAAINNCISGIGVFFSLIAAVGAASAAVFAYWAYTQAKSQAAAAWASADASSEPYLSLVFTNSAEIQRDIGENFARVGITLTNYGEAPAIIDSAQCASAYGSPQNVDFKLIDGFNGVSTDNAVRTLKKGQVIIKGQPVSVMCDGIFPENSTILVFPRNAKIDQIRNALFEHPLWVLARVNYEDIFGNHMQSVFCARFDWLLDDFSDAEAFTPFKAPECQDDGND